MKTVIVFEQFDDPIKLLLADIDLDHLDGTLLNAVPENEDDASRQRELQAIVYDEQGRLLLDEIDRNDAILHVRAGANLIFAGFVP